MTPPANVGYARAAYVVATAVYGLYAYSLWSRARRLARRWRSERGAGSLADRASARPR